jgi:hypothetical protein
MARTLLRVTAPDMSAMRTWRTSPGAGFMAALSTATYADRVSSTDPRAKLESTLRALQAARSAAEQAERAGRAHRAAADAAAIAARHEMLAQRRPSAAELHERMAALHRRNEACQRAAANMLSTFSHSLERWAARPDADVTLRPVLMEAVAATVGWQGAVLTLNGRSGSETLVAASDKTTRRAHELEMTLAEGPMWEAIHGHMTMANDLELDTHWPRFGPAVRRLGVQAVAAVPLRLGTEEPAGCLTVMGPRQPRPTTEQWSLCDVADALSLTVLRDRSRTEPGSMTVPILPSFEAEDMQPTLHQAAGVLRERCGWNVSDAIAIIRARAYAEERSVADVAEDVLNGSLLP